MAKIILGSRPKDFKKEVKFTMLDGSIGSIEPIYTYRTRKEYGEFADAVNASAKALNDADIAAIEAASKEGSDLPVFSQSQAMDRATAQNVDYIMDCVKGWNLDVPFSRAAVEQLADEVPAAIGAIVSTYRSAIVDGRLGN